jgi:hypothetical protein
MMSPTMAIETAEVAGDAVAPDRSAQAEDGCPAHVLAEGSHTLMIRPR